jgi:hypothetical protein
MNKKNNALDTISLSTESIDSSTTSSELCSSAVGGHCSKRRKNAKEDAAMDTVIIRNPCERNCLMLGTVNSGLSERRRNVGEGEGKGKGVPTHAMKTFREVVV